MRSTRLLTMEATHNSQVRFSALSIEFQPFYPRWIVQVKITPKIGTQTEQTVEIKGNHNLTVVDVWAKAVNQLTNPNPLP